MSYIFYPPHLPPPTAPKLVQGETPPSDPPFDSRQRSHLIAILSWQPNTIVEVPLLPTVDVVGWLGKPLRIQDILISWLPPEPFPFNYLHRGPYTEGITGPSDPPFDSRLQANRAFLINSIWDLRNTPVEYDFIEGHTEFADDPPFNQRRDISPFYSQWDTQFPSQFKNPSFIPVTTVTVDNPPFGASRINIPILYDAWFTLIEQHRVLESIQAAPDDPPFGQRRNLTEQLSWNVYSPFNYNRSLFVPQVIADNPPFGQRRDFTSILAWNIDVSFNYKRPFVAASGILAEVKVPFTRLQLSDLYEWWDVAAQQQRRSFVISTVDDPPFNSRQYLFNIINAWVTEPWPQQKRSFYIPPVIFTVDNPPFGYTRRQMMAAEFWDNWSWYIHEYRRLGGVRIPSRGPWVPITPPNGGPWVPTTPGGGGPWTPINPDVNDVWTPLPR